MGCKDYHALKRDIINEHTHKIYFILFYLFFICAMRGVCATVASSVAHSTVVTKNAFLRFATDEKKTFDF